MTAPLPNALPSPDGRRACGPWIAALAALLTASALASPAAAQRGGALEGVVQDALTGRPLVGARVRALGAGVEATTDGAGRYRLAVPDEGDWAVWVQPVGAQAPEPATFVHQRAGTPATLNILGGGLFIRFPSLATPYGLPGGSGRVDGPGGPADLAAWWGARGGWPAQALGLDMPMPLPATVRVARRFASSCSGNPIQRIDEVPLEEYVHGVLLPEIGVFKSAATGRESSREVFKAFAVAARTYALYFVVRGTNDAQGYDLDDTACNQRYDDQRDAWVEALVAETAGQVMVRRGTAGEFDKFEYAASCGRHSSWPEYQDAYVSDAGLGQVCVGNWCGHDDCAAHQDNPQLPGDDRCLVRGVCQWGSMERSALGQSYLEILGHYQPNLDVRDFAAVPPTGGRVEGVVRSSLDGSPVPGARAALAGVGSQIASEVGFFEFVGVEAGSHDLSVSAPGFEPAERRLEVLAGQTTQLDLRLDPVGAVEPEPEPGEPEASPEAGEPDSGEPEAGPDPGEPEAEEPGSDFPLFGVVPEGGLSGSSGGCSVSVAVGASGAGGGWRGWALLAVAAALWRRGRGCAARL